jgi:hypothetical protein
VRRRARVVDFSFFRLVPLIKTIDPAPTIFRHAAWLAALRGTSMPRGVTSTGPPKRRRADLSHANTRRRSLPPQPSPPPPCLRERHRLPRGLQCRNDCLFTTGSFPNFQLV